MFAINLLVIGLGGFFGAVTRYIFCRKLNPTYKSGFPLGTFTVNLLACGLIGIISGIFPGISHVTLFFITGFSGALSTFSTYIYEYWELSKSKRALGGFYMLISILGGLLIFESAQFLSKSLIPN